MKLHSLEDLMLTRHSSSIQPDIFLMQCRCLGTITSWVRISSYINDNLVLAKIFKESMIALEHPFIAFQKFRLRLNLEKCTFLTTKAKFLSHHKQCRIQANPEYVHTIVEMKPPTIEKELQYLIRHLVWIQQFFEIHQQK